jgi:hypothetical protein
MKVNVSALFREWGLPDYLVKMGKKGLRWRQPLEKGIAWYWFAKYIRERDFKKYQSCISCGRRVENVEELQCGHFKPAQNCGNILLLDEQNNNGECGGCNAFDEGHIHGYRKNLIARIGVKAVERLDEMYEEAKRNILGPEHAPKSKAEWEHIANTYRAKCTYEL